jgi:hypothetical protein
MRWRSLRERYSKELRNTIKETRSGKPIFEESSWEWFNYMNFLSDIVKPRKTAASNITLQIREDYCSPSNNCYTSSFFDSNSEYTEQVSPHTPRNLESQEDEYDLEETSVPEKTFHVSTPPTVSRATTPKAGTSQKRKGDPLEKTVQNSKKIKNKDCLTNNEIDLRLVKILEKSESNNCVEDEDDVFCKALAFELRKIKDEKEKQRRKAKLYLVATGLE